MVARRFVVRHNGEDHLIDYDTEDGFEVLQFQIFSLTSIPPDEQKIVTEKESVVLKEDSDLAAVSDELCLLSVVNTPDISVSDEELARLLQAEEEAVYLQQFQASGNRAEFENRVRSYVPQILLYEDPIRLEAARRTVPVDEIEERSLILLAKEGNFKPTNDEKSHAFMLELLFWFKQSFRWVNSMPCDGCGAETISVGMGVALPSEIQYGGSRIELYRCKSCSRITRFPRYNDPLKLLETRRGRCGEWANCFTLYCRAFGFDSRLILDFTDHVWTECFSHLLGRWIHLDPCEGAYDKPLLYEKGWNKKLNYVIAISKDGVYDVTKRYTRTWHEVLGRRNITTEAVVSAALSDITSECRRRYSSEMIYTLKLRDERETEELETNVHINIDSSFSLPGRQSGSEEWRIARSEWAPQELISSTGASPPRKCNDRHVTNIYSSFSLLISHLSKKEEAAGILKDLKKLLLDLRACPFKERKAILDSQGIFSCSSNLFEAISLKGNVLPDGRVSVTLAGEPVLTALTLPVALDVIEEKINQFSDPSIDSFLQFSRSNRIASGLVMASGEELPSGIATSAFDGLSSSKWEEPKGARGCWIIYKLTDGKIYNLDGYELTSANDAPERDPFDWILEGSKTEGLSWEILDSQNSQIFERRFQRKLFKIKKSIHSCNLFRFRFLRVRDSVSNSRFQIGSIDLYGNLTSQLLSISGYINLRKISRSLMT